MIRNLLVKHLLCFDLILQNKYKQSGKKSMSSSLYAQLPQTAETQLAAKMSDLQSEVTNACTREAVDNQPIRRPQRPLCVSAVQNKYKEDGMRSLSQNFYSQLPDTAETQLAKTVSELQSEVTTRHLPDSNGIFSVMGHSVHLDL